MMVLVLVIGIGSGWLARGIRSAQIQRDAVVAIQKAGGFVLYDWEWSDGNPIPGGRPWGPGWLADRAGVDCFGNVSYVAFYRFSTLNDATVAQVGRLTELRALDLVDWSARDADLARLKGLTKLRWLYLGVSNVSDAGVRELQRELPGLAIERPGVRPWTRPEIVAGASRAVGDSKRLSRVVSWKWISWSPLFAPRYLSAAAKIIMREGREAMRQAKA